MAYLFLAAFAALAFSSCNDSDYADVPENTHLVSEEVQDAFNAKYPQARDVEWELKGDYAVVDFDWNGGEHSAWFNPASGAWCMTDTDIRYESLPEPVLAAHQSGEYADWRVDDVDMLTREGMETLYVVEVEKGEAEVELSYLPTGVLFKVVGDGGQAGGNDGYLPQPDAQGIMAVVKQKYPQATIVEVERENGLQEVTILDGNKEKEVYFDDRNEWVKTVWDVRPADLPEAVRLAVAAKYQGYVIDDADSVVTPSGEWYELDLEDERTDREWEDVKIAADGAWL